MRLNSTAIKSKRDPNLFYKCKNVFYKPIKLNFRLCTEDGADFLVTPKDKIRKKFA